MARHVWHQGVSETAWTASHTSPNASKTPSPPQFRDALVVAIVAGLDQAKVFFCLWSLAFRTGEESLSPVTRSAEFRADYAREASSLTSTPPIGQRNAEGQCRSQVPSCGWQSYLTPRTAVVFVIRSVVEGLLRNSRGELWLECCTES